MVQERHRRSTPRCHCEGTIMTTETEQGTHTPCRHCGSSDINPSRIARADWICRACESRRSAAWRERRRTEGRSVSGSNTWDPAKKAAWRQRYYGQPDVREKLAAKARARTARPDERSRHEARWAVNRAVAAGRLIKQPCRCGEIKVDGHHPDYSKPLEVVWLCRPCHMDEHAKARGQAS